MINRTRLDEWQYKIFQWVLFILFLNLVFRILDHELHLTHYFKVIAGMVSTG